MLYILSFTINLATYCILNKNLKLCKLQDPIMFRFSCYSQVIEFRFVHKTTFFRAFSNHKIKVTLKLFEKCTTLFNKS